MVKQWGQVKKSSVSCQLITTAFFLRCFYSLRYSFAEEGKVSPDSLEASGGERSRGRGGGGGGKGWESGANTTSRQSI